MNKEQTQAHYEAQATKAKQLVHYTWEASKIPKVYTKKDNIDFRLSARVFDAKCVSISFWTSKETFDEVFNRFQEETARIMGIIK